MSNEEILKEAIKKAQAHGYRLWVDEEEVNWADQDFSAMANNALLIRSFIFSWDFAKAFFGKAKHYKWELAPEYADENRTLLIGNFIYNKWCFMKTQLVI